MPAIETVRVIAYKKLGLSIPNGTGVFKEGLRVSERPIATGGFGGSFNPNSSDRRVAPVEVTNLGVEIQATGESARTLTGDESVEAVILGTNPRKGESALTIYRATTDGVRERKVIDLEKVSIRDRELLTSIQESLQDSLQGPRQPFESKPAVDFRTVGIPSLNHQPEKPAVRPVRRLALVS